MMDLITVDFETFYSQDFSLSKLTTEEYVRDPQFEVIGLGVKVNDGETEWASGTPEQMERYLKKFDWESSAVLAHNTMFDGAILSWCFDIRPRLWLDTLCMGRALHGVEVGGSLKALAERYGIGEKGTEVLNAKGKRREDFTPDELGRYGDYCVNDVDLTHKLFRMMRTNLLLSTGNDFPKTELKLIDLTLRMFIEPTLDLDLGLLEQHLMEVKQRKDELLASVGVDKKELMSNPKFAELLRALSVEPPMKISPTTGKQTYAFAKSDEEFKALQEHEDDRVQALVTARLGTKSTLEETRTQRFIDIAKRGLLPVPVRYYAAHTGRWGGDDKINMQNLPSRGPNAKKLKSSIIAPPGHVLIDADSAQIEARVLAWLAEQEDLVQAFFNKDDVYKQMASRIYGRDVDEITKDERFVGKTTILGAGYGMGALKFQAQLKTFGYDLDLDECRRVINVYRETNWRISQFWQEAQNVIECLQRGESMVFGVDGLLEAVGPESAIRLPSGLLMRYDELDFERGEKGFEYSYKTRRGRTRIYGGKVTENVCQAVARCIIGEQMLRISKRYRVVLTVHDSIVCCVPEREVDEAQAYVEACMRWVPSWAEGLPIDCESGTGTSYGECG
jgi:DNA polymerase I-like protein with 3'-5' exonuclease and polymerase domains